MWRDAGEGIVRSVTSLLTIVLWIPAREEMRPVPLQRHCLASTSKTYALNALIYLNVQEVHSYFRN